MNTQKVMNFVQDGMAEDGSSYGLKMAAYKTVSQRVKVTEKTVRNWVSDFEMMTIVRESRRGKHSKTMSPIVDTEFKLKFKEFVKTNSRRQGKNVLKIFITGHKRGL